MLKENKQYIAVVMIIVLAATMVGLYLINRSHRDDMSAEYEAALLRQAEQQQARLAASDAQSALESAMNEEIARIAAVNVPGVSFYGTKMSESETGTILPLIVESLIDQNVCDTDVSVVDLIDIHETIQQRTYLPVIFICEDAWDGNIDALIARQKELIAGRERYIVLGMPTGSRAEMRGLEASMAAEYGDKYINLREYLSTDGMASINMTIHPEDIEAMASGLTPPGLLADDGVTLNESGYRLAAFLTYDRMTELGYFDEILNAVKQLSGGN